MFDIATVKINDKKYILDFSFDLTKLYNSTVSVKLILFNYLGSPLVKDSVIDILVNDINIFKGNIISSSLSTTNSNRELVLDLELIASKLNDISSVSKNTLLSSIFDTNKGNYKLKNDYHFLDTALNQDKIAEIVKTEKLGNFYIQGDYVYFSQDEVSTIKNIIDFSTNVLLDTKELQIICQLNAFVNPNQKIKFNDVVYTIETVNMMWNYKTGFIQEIYCKDKIVDFLDEEGVDE